MLADSSERCVMTDFYYKGREGATVSTDTLMVVESWSHITVWVTRSRSELSEELSLMPAGNMKICTGLVW